MNGNNRKQWDQREVSVFDDDEQTEILNEDSSCDFNGSEFEEGQRHNFQNTVVNNKQLGLNSQKMVVNTSIRQTAGRMKDYLSSDKQMPVLDTTVKIDYNEGKNYQTRKSPRPLTQNTYLTNSNNQSPPQNIYQRYVTNGNSKNTSNQKPFNFTRQNRSYEKEQSTNNTLQDEVYKHMFHNIIKTREKSPLSSHQDQVAMTKYKGDHKNLKRYFQSRLDNKNNEIKQLNQSCSQRLLEKGETYRLKREVMQKFENFKGLDECSFQPQVNRSNSPSRDLQTYINDQESFFLTKKRKINEKLQSIEQEKLLKANETHVSKGSQKLFMKVDRYRTQNSPKEQSQNLYDLGKQKLIRMTKEEVEIRQYLNDNASWQLQRQMMSSQSLRELREQSNDSSQLFNPQINERSKQMVRTESVGNILYKDALERRKQSIEKFQKRENSQMKNQADKKSELYLIKGFKNEFENYAQKGKGFQNLEDYIDLLVGLGFINIQDQIKVEIAIQLFDDAQIIQSLKYSQKVEENLFIILAAIMNINASDSFSTSFQSQNRSLLQESQQNNLSHDNLQNSQLHENADYMQGNLSSFSQSKDSKSGYMIQQLIQQSLNNSVTGFLLLSQKQIQQIHSYFLPLFYQRQSFLAQRRHQSRSPKNEPTFKPSLNNKSLKMADKLLKKLKTQQQQTQGISKTTKSQYSDILLVRSKHTENKIFQLQNSKKDLELKECSFKPHISYNSKIMASNRSQSSLTQGNDNQSAIPERPVASKFQELHEEYKVKKLRDNKTTEQVEYERSYQECTFQPNAHKRGSQSRQRNNQSQLTAKNSGQESKSKKIILGKESTKNKNINYHSKKVNLDPQYVIGIEIEGINHKINIFEGDKPEQVILSFCEDKKSGTKMAHQLDSADQPIGTQTTSKDKKTYFLETSAFLTGVNIVEKGPKKLDETIPKAAEINFTYNKLNELVTDLGSKISDVIKDHENDFFVAFKNKMYAIMKEMRELKEKASSERHKAKQEARLINLEKERDWFRREALKLDKMCKDHKRILNKLKATLENIEEDRDFFQEQLFNAKKVNKALLMELEKYKGSVTLQDGGGSMSAMKLQYSQPLAITSNGETQKFNNRGSTTKLKSEIGHALKQTKDDINDEDLVINDEAYEDGFRLRDLEGSDGETNIDILKEYEPKAHEYKMMLGQSSVKKFDTKQLTDSIKQTHNAASVPLEEYRKIVQENAELKEKEIKYAETIRHLKNSIDSEKKNARSLRAEKVNFIMQRNELEEFFLQCIEEVRKDIVKRKTITSATKKGNQRSTSTASMSKLGSQGFGEEGIQNAKLDQYTATDKRKVIELLMSNENVLLFLYEKLFPVTNLSQQSTAQSRGQTAGVMSNNGGVHIQSNFKFDSGVPIGGNNLIGNNRSQTSVGSSRMNLGRAHLNSMQNYGTIGASPGMDILGASNQTLPQNLLPGMSIQNNIQNLNLNINLAKGAYGSSPFIPPVMQNPLNRGATAPLGQQRAKKGFQAQMNALNKNKYAL